MSKNLPAELLETLRCTRCKGDVKMNGEYLSCGRCNVRYPIVDSIPVMRGDRKLEGISDYEDLEFARKFDAVRLGERAERGRRGLIDKILAMAQIGKGTRVLSVGVGTGLYEQHLTPSNVIALDYSLAMLTVAREKGIKNLVCADVRELPFPDGTFDCVLLINCGSLRHSEEDSGVTVREMKRVLRGGGQLIVVLPNQVFNIMVGMVLHANPGYDRYGVYPARVSKLLRKQGIQVADNRTFFTLDPELKFRRAVDKLLHILGINCFGATIIIRGRV